MTYRVELGPVRKALRDLDATARRRVLAALVKLEEDPRHAGAKKLHGAGYLWRVRVGDLRAVYHVDDDASLVLVLRIAHRREVYRSRR